MADYPMESALSIPATLEATIDGEEYLHSSVPIHFFRSSITFTLKPACGPVVGGTEVKLVLDGTIFDSSEVCLE